MNYSIYGLIAIATFVVTCLLGSAQSLAQNAYITNNESNTVSVIDTATNTVAATIPVGVNPSGVAVTPDGSKAYVTTISVSGTSGSASVIDTAMNTVTAVIPVGVDPNGVAVTPDGSKVYVANVGSNNVSVINTTTNTVTAIIGVGTSLYALGIFIQPLRFAGTPGKANCYGQSVSALARQYHGLNAAAAALGKRSRARRGIRC